MAARVDSGGDPRIVDASPLLTEAAAASARIRAAAEEEVAALLSAAAYEAGRLVNFASRHAAEEVALAARRGGHLLAAATEGADEELASVRRACKKPSLPLAAPGSGSGRGPMIWLTRPP